MSIANFEGFDVYWFKPNVDNSFALLAQLDIGIVVSHLYPTTAQKLAELWSTGRIGYGKCIKNPLNVLLTIANNPYNEHTFGVAFRQENTANNSTNALIFSAWNGIPSDGSSPLFALQGIISGSNVNLQLVRGGTWNKNPTSGWGLTGATVIATINNAFAVGSWAYIEMRVVKETTFKVEIRVNGEQKLALTDTNVSGIDVYGLWVGSNFNYKNASGQSIPQHFFDDLYWVVNDGNAPTGFLGDVYVWTAVPSAAVDTQWNATSQGHLNSVNEGYITPSANDPQYVYTSSIGAKEGWQYSFPTSDIYSIHAVKFYGSLSTNVASFPLNVYARLLNNEVERVGIVSLSQYGNVYEGKVTSIFTKKPDNTAWLPSDLNSVVIGVKTT